jgi:hypothetical protein
MKNFHEGDRFIYITRIDSRLADMLGYGGGRTGPRYLAVAALRTVAVWQSHREASIHFGPQRYVATPAITPYPPNLAFEAHPRAAAAARACSIIHDEHDRPHLPDDATDHMWTRAYLGYRTRQSLAANFGQPDAESRP